MKLMIVSESPLEKIGPDYYAVDTWIRFIQHLSFHFEQTTLWAPVVVREAGYHLSSHVWHVELGDLMVEHQDYYSSFIEYYRLWPGRHMAWRKRAAQLIGEQDVVVLRLPSPMVSIVTRAARRKGKPLVVLVCGDVAKSDRVIANRGLKRLFYLVLGKLLVLQETRCAKHAVIVYAYNSELAHRNRNTSGRLVQVRTPHLSEHDFVLRDDTCQSKEIRLLRVGWLMPLKGVEYLLEAVAMLLSKGLRVCLEIVGKERGPGYQARLEKYADDLGIRDKVDFMGWIPFDRMGDVYTRNDIQVISSLAEGIPRCIAEGAARGLPLISTTAGGAHEILVHEQEALFVSPGDPVAIAEAVERLIQDSALRRRIIKHGYKAARAVTFEQLGMQIVNEIREVTRFHRDS